MSNPYLPLPVRIDKIVTETEDRMLKTFQLSFVRTDDADFFEYRPGQFAELSLAGFGEIPIGIASSPTEKGFLKFTINRVGLVTAALHNLQKGAMLGVRGPLGNGFPWKALEGKNIVFIGGGFAFTTLRSSIVYILDPVNRAKFGKIWVMYGARSPGMLLYQDEIKHWIGYDDIEVKLTVDNADGCSWPHQVGFVPQLVARFAPQGDADTYAIVCAPPIVIKMSQPILSDLGYDSDKVLLSLENRMKCGIGMCGRCNIGAQFVCKDGPVFSLRQMEALPKDY